ncbi:MAG: PIN domain-containing protein [Acidobacteriota bacterium]|nr:PIN domain-containing protein [Acidobacteriota bacterium]
MAVVLLDSVAIVAYLDAANVFHRAADAAIGAAAREDRLVSSAVNYAEVLTGARLGHRDEEVVRGFFSELVAEVVPVDREVAERAAELRGSRMALRLPDALIMATADLHADVLIGADAQWAKVKGLGCELRLMSAARTTKGPRPGS